MASSEKQIKYLRKKIESTLDDNASRIPGWKIRLMKDVAEETTDLEELRDMVELEMQLRALEYAAERITEGEDESGVQVTEIKEAMSPELAKKKQRSDNAFKDIEEIKQEYEIIGPRTILSDISNREVIKNVYRSMQSRYAGVDKVRQDSREDILSFDDTSVKNKKNTKPSGVTYANKSTEKTYKMLCRMVSGLEDIMGMVVK